MASGSDVQIRWTSILERAGRSPGPTVAVVLCALGLAAFVPNLDRAPFYHLVEGDQALVVREIYEGDWLLPMLNGDTLPSKPPLFNWLGALAAIAAGRLSEGTVRLPSALASAAGLGVAYAVGRRLVGSPAAILGSLFLLTTPVYAKQARDATTDAVLSFWLAVAFALFYAMYDLRDWSGWRRRLFFLAIAGAVLTKGPVGYALPALACVAFLAWKRDLEPVLALASGADKWIAILLPLSWYAIATILGGQSFIEKQFLDENLRRFMGGFGLPQSPASLIVPSFREALPWSILLAIGLVRLTVTRSWTDGTRFLVCWWATVLVFFSLSVGKRSIYLLPLYPAAALLAAAEAWHWASRVRPEAAAAATRIWPAEWASLAAACVAAVLLTGMARVIGPHEIPAATDVESERRHFAAYLVLEHPALAVLVLALAFALIVTVAARLRDGRWGEIPLSVVMFLVPFYVLAFPLLRDHHKEIRSVKAFGLEVAGLVPRDDPVYFYRYGSKELPGYLYFYVGRHVPSAPCSHFARDCPAAHYLMWERDWHEGDEKLAARAVLLAHSAQTSMFPRYAPFVLVRLRARPD